MAIKQSSFRQYDPSTYKLRVSPDYGATQNFIDSAKQGRQYSLGQSIEDTAHLLILDHISKSKDPESVLSEEDFNDQYAKYAESGILKYQDGRTVDGYNFILRNKATDSMLESRLYNSGGRSGVQFLGGVVGGSSHPIDLATAMLTGGASKTLSKTLSTVRATGIVSKSVNAAKAAGLITRKASSDATKNLGVRMATKAVSGAQWGMIDGARDSFAIYKSQEYLQGNYTFDDALVEFTANVALNSLAFSGSELLHSREIHKTLHSTTDPAADKAVRSSSSGSMKDVVEHVTSEMASADDAALAYQKLKRTKELLTKTAAQVDAIGTLIKQLKSDGKPISKHLIKANDKLQARLDQLKAESGEARVPIKDKLFDAVTKPDRIISEILSLLGRKARFFDGTNPSARGRRGYVSSADPNVIHLASSETFDNIVYVAGHEFAHSIKFKNPKLWLDIVDVIKSVDDEILEKAYMDAFSMQDEFFARKTGAERMDEAFANVMGDAFSSRSFWRGLHKKDPSLLRTVIDNVREIIDRAFATLKRRQKDLDPKQRREARKMYERIGELITEAEHYATDPDKPKSHTDLITEAAIGTEAKKKKWDGLIRAIYDGEDKFVSAREASDLDWQAIHAGDTQPNITTKSGKSIRDSKYKTPQAYAEAIYYKQNESTRKRKQERIGELYDTLRRNDVKIGETNKAIMTLRNSAAKNTAEGKAELKKLYAKAKRLTATRNKTRQHIRIAKSEYHSNIDFTYDKKKDEYHFSSPSNEKLELIEAKDAQDYVDPREVYAEKLADIDAQDIEGAIGANELDLDGGVRDTTDLGIEGSAIPDSRYDSRALEYIERPQYGDNPDAIPSSGWKHIGDNIKFDDTIDTEHISIDDMDFQSFFDEFFLNEDSPLNKATWHDFVAEGYIGDPHYPHPSNTTSEIISEMRIPDVKGITGDVLKKYRAAKQRVARAEPKAKDASMSQILDTFKDRASKAKKEFDPSQLTAFKGKEADLSGITAAGDLTKPWTSKVDEAKAKEAEAKTKAKESGETYEEAKAEPVEDLTDATTYLPDIIDIREQIENDAEHLLTRFMSDDAQKYENIGNTLRKLSNLMPTANMDSIFQETIGAGQGTLEFLAEITPHFQKTLYRDAIVHIQEGRWLGMAERFGPDRFTDAVKGAMDAGFRKSLGKEYVGINSIDNEMASRRVQHTTPFVQILSDYNVLDEFMASGDFTQAIIEAVSNPKNTNYPEPILAIREIIQDTNKVQVSEAQASGIQMNYRDDFAITQRHSYAPMKEVGKDTWMRETTEMVDLNRMGLADLEPDEAITKLNQILSDTYDSVMDGKQYMDSANKVGGDMDSLDRHYIHSRHIIFKPEHVYDYDMRYGSGDTGRAVLDQMQKRADRIVLSENFSPDMDSMSALILGRIPEKNRKSVRSMLDTLNGRIDTPLDPELAQKWTSVRQLMNLALMGMSGISSIMDVSTVAAQLRFNGVSLGMLDRKLFSDVKNAFVRQVQSGEGLQFLQAHGAGIESVTNSAARRILGENLGGRGLLRNANNMMFKVNGLNLITNVMQDAITTQVLKHLGNSTLDNNLLLDALARHGISADDLSFAQAFARDIPGVGENIVSPYFFRKANPELSAKFFNYLDYTMRAGVVEPDVGTRAMLRGGINSGTHTGQAIRTATQYMAVPIATLKKVHQRYALAYGQEGFINMMKNPNASGMTHILAFTASSLAMAYVTTNLKNIVKGKDVFSFTDMNEHELSRVLYQSGLAGPLSDLFFVNNFGDFAETAAGPAFGAAIDVATAPGISGKLRRAGHYAPGATLPIIGNAWKELFALAFGDAVNESHRVLRGSYREPVPDERN